MNAVLPCATFRDPAGSVSFEDGQVVRRVSYPSRQQVLDFLDSPFCQRAQLRGDLIDATVLNSSEGLCLLHPRLSPATYPWEWTPSQWLSAAELTLNLAEEALAEGWILKDATPLNVLFSGTRPVFVDILSFARRDPGMSVWLAYGQYVRTLLLPLLMQRMLSWPLSLSLFKRDGYEPEECYAALSWPQRISRSALWPITLPTLLDKRKQTGKPSAAAVRRMLDAETTGHILQRTFKDLRRRTQNAMPPESSSEWSDYQSSLTHYSAEESGHKFEWVRSKIRAIQPERVLDLGANTGEFSALAASESSDVVAIERDASAAERLFCMARERGLRIQTIQADIARPTPAVGWLNRESPSLLDRLAGDFDLVLMLAVIHHLLLMEQIPLPSIMSLCAQLTRRHLILEWVPVEDPMYQSLMRGRDSLYGSLSEENLFEACEQTFRVVTREPLANGRVLFHLEKVH